MKSLIAHLSRSSHYVLFVGWLKPADDDHFVEISDSLGGLYLYRFDNLVAGLGRSRTITGIQPV